MKRRATFYLHCQCNMKEWYCFQQTTVSGNTLLSRFLEHAFSFMECHLNIMSLKPLCCGIVVSSVVIEWSKIQGYCNIVLVDEYAFVIQNLTVECWHIFLRLVSTCDGILLNICSTEALVDLCVVLSKML